MVFRFWPLAVVCLVASADVAASQSAPHRECFRFRHEANEAVEIEIGAKTVTIYDRGETITLEQVITKPFGQLIAVAVDLKEENPQEHFFQVIEMNGREALIYDSQVFRPVCKRPSLVEWRAPGGGDRLTRVSEFQHILHFRGGNYACTIDHHPSEQEVGSLSCEGRVSFALRASSDEKTIFVDDVKMEQGKPILPAQ